MNMADNKPKKNIPTIFPSGFGVRVNQNNIIALDFFDLDYENNTNVVGSYAMDISTIVKLKDNLEVIIKKINEK